VVSEAGIEKHEKWTAKFESSSLEVDINTV
jgi:hypothetical protein